MGMGSLPSFALTWAAMTAAVMSPSTLPFVVSFARRARRWPLGSVVLVAAYLLVWTGFGVAAYFVSNATSLPWAASTAAGLGITFAGLYSLTPLKRLGQARCIEMCRRRASIDGLGLRTAAAAGTAYGLGCVACSGGVMVALMVLGMTNVLWLAAGAAVVLLYKLAGLWPRRLEMALTVAMVLAGAWLIALA